MHYRHVLYVVGRLVVIVALTLFVPAGVAVIYGETAALTSFLWAAGGGLVLGTVMMTMGQRDFGSLRRREGLAIVGLAWIAASLVGGAPYVLTGVIPDPVGAAFEAMSGFTTTGASVLRNVEFMATGEPTPKSVLFWRCMTNWLGGVGIVVLFVALLPALGVGGKVLLGFEVPGVGEKGFMPRVRQTARTLWKIYVILSAVLVGILLLLGVDLYHAVCHSFATLATGGFSSHDASVGHYESAAVQVVITLFMFMAGVNFTLYFAMGRGKWRSLVKDVEFRVYAAIIVLAITTIAVDLMVQDQVENVGDAARLSAFQVVSIGTTTGFATDDFDVWPTYSRIMLVLLMFVGGCAGSTAGGLKIVRVIILFKYALRQLARQISPRRVEKLRLGGNVVDDELVRSIVGMFLLFLLCYGFGVLALAAMGVDMTTSLSASLASIANIGPGFGAVGATGNYAAIPAAGKVVLTLLMLVGRLEIFTALSLFVPSLWRD